MANNFQFSKWNFAQSVNRSVMLLVYRELHSLSVKDVALLEDAQLIFLIFNTFVCAFGWVDGRLDAVRVNKNH